MQSLENKSFKCFWQNNLFYVVCIFNKKSFLNDFNETKLTSRNAFILNLFALKSEKKEKKKGQINPLLGLPAES